MQVLFHNNAILSLTLYLICHNVNLFNRILNIWQSLIQTRLNTTHGKLKNTNHHTMDGRKSRDEALEGVSDYEQQIIYYTISSQ